MAPGLGPDCQLWSTKRALLEYKRANPRIDMIQQLGEYRKNFGWARFQGELVEKYTFIVPCQSRLTIRGRSGVFPWQPKAEELRRGLGRVEDLPARCQLPSSECLVHPKVGPRFRCHLTGPVTLRTLRFKRRPPTFVTWQGDWDPDFRSGSCSGPEVHASVKKPDANL